jgi:2,3-diketo-5-methylthio-1-phosphopentane phosphatase
MTNNNSIKIFVDFDGTISTFDVGREIFFRFGSKDYAEKIISQLHSGEINSRQSWESLIENVESIDSKIFFDFIDSIPLDPTFRNFVDYCNSNDIEIIILSDGFDIYIKRILQREGLDNLKFYANNLSIKEGKLVVAFPHYNPDYPSSSINKIKHIIDNSSDDDFTIYIGDGNSDKEAAQYCDLIFAKDNLLKFCEINRISFFPFSNFNDVLELLKKLQTKKRLRKSHQANLKRKIAYEAE